jgi:hypothetical protein
MHRSYQLLLVGVALAAANDAWSAERTQRFDRDPGWDGRNHRAVQPEPRAVRQDFGYSRTNHAGGVAGEVGGLITPAGEKAFYGARIPMADFGTPLSASGRLVCDDRPSHLLLGFFNANSLNEWRTPNTIALRINGRGDVFLAYVEYCTARWRAGGDHPRSFPAVANESGRFELKGFPAKGAVHRWTLAYDPSGNEGQGVVTASVDDATAVCNLAPEHKADGATFDHFGMLPVMKSVDGGGEFWIDDVTINGRADDFSSDPKWDGFNNRASYTSTIVRPRFDFGFSPTEWAGGRSGELGGLVFRGDCRYPERMACYGDRLETLALDKPLKAAGKVALRRGVSDSGVLIGFFNSQESMRSNPSQKQGLPRDFFGISTDAPSRDGFYFAPTYRIGEESASSGFVGQPPHLYPDGQSHDWTFDYSPVGAAGNGEIAVTLDKQSIKLSLAPGHKTAGARFDRFGIISTWIDGNSQAIYFDDLTYTFRQD